MRKITRGNYRPSLENDRYNKKKIVRNGYFTCGKYKGKTLIGIFNKDPDYVSWAKKSGLL